MTYVIMIGVFFVLLLLGAPIALSLGLSSLLAVLYNHVSLTVVAASISGGIGKYLLLAVPFFVLSGNIMAKAGISERLIAFVDALVGHMRGGIATVCVVVACFFGAISGSGAATVAALGVILIPAMNRMPSKSSRPICWQIRSRQTRKWTRWKKPWQTELKKPGSLPPRVLSLTRPACWITTMRATMKGV